MKPFNLSQHLRRSPLNIADYGAKGDYNPDTGTGTDDTDAFNKAIFDISTTGGMIWIPPYMKCLVEGNINLPMGVSIHGSSSMGMNQPYILKEKGSTIYLNPAASIYLYDSCGLDGVNVFRKGIQFNITSAQVITQFQGTAITLQNDSADHFVRNLVILGFAYGIKSQTTSGSSVSTNRSKLYNLLIDCQNGVWIHQAVDVPSIIDVECWPAVTLESPPETNGAQLKRSGTGIKLSGTNDWTRLVNPFTFGYQIGFAITDSSSVTIMNGGADHPAQSVPDSSYGFVINGSAVEARLIAPQVAAKNFGVGVDTSSALMGVEIVDGNFWECDFGLAVTKGNVQMIGGSTRAPLKANGVGVTAALTTSQITVIGHHFNTLDHAFQAADITVMLRHKLCSFTNIANLDQSPYTPTITAAATITLDGRDDVYRILGTATITTINSAINSPGRIITLISFDGATFARGGNLYIASNFVATAWDSITLASISGVWFEIARSANAP